MIFNINFSNLNVFKFLWKFLTIMSLSNVKNICVSLKSLTYFNGFEEN